jgi:hypothetical protein
MKRLLIFLCLVVLVIAPAAAYSFTYMAPDDKALEIITITSNGDTSGTLTIYQGNADTISGAWSYGNYDIFALPFPHSHATISLEGDTTSFGYATPGTLQLTVWATGNISNTQVAKMGMGQSSGVYNGVVETTISNSPIIGYRIDSDNAVTTDQVLISRVAAEKATSPEAGTGILENLKTYLEVITGTFLNLIWWLKFLFFDNLLLIFLLYFTGSMAYAANTSKNIFVFYKTWFRQQIAFFNFVANSFSTVINIATQTIQAVLKWI